MTIPSPFHDYLTGKAFSSALSFPLKAAGEQPPHEDRLALLTRIVAGERVIHVGCADHPELFADKFARNTWLHGRIAGSASRCIGVDVNRAAIDQLVTQYGVRDVFCADILESPPQAVRDQSWDVLLLGEMLEHLPAPWEYLCRLRQAYRHNVNAILITVPNAFAWLNLKHIFRHEEYINSDHRFWFSPYTLAKLISDAGMTVDSATLCDYILPDPPRFRDKIKPAWFLPARFPGLRECVVIRARLN